MGRPALPSGPHFVLLAMVLWVYEQFSDLRRNSYVVDSFAT